MFSEKKSNKGIFSLDALDVVAAILAAFIGVIIIAVSFKPQDMTHTEVIFSGTGVVVLVTSLFYIAFKGKLRGGYSLSFQLSERGRIINHIIFLVVLSLSLCLLWGSLYHRPPMYFALLLIAVASIALEIVSLEEPKQSQVYIILLKTVALGLSVYGGIYYLFPGVYGGDPWGHNWWVTETVNSGQITTEDFSGNATYYYILPIFYSLAAMTKVTTDLSVYSSIFVCVLIPMALSCLFIYLIGRKLATAKVGLLSALIFCLTDAVIERSTAIIAMSLGLYFGIAILYVLICLPRNMVSRFLIIYLAGCLIFIHPIATLAILVSVIAVFAGVRFHKRITKALLRFASIEISLNFIMAFTVAMMFNWMRAPPGRSSLLDWNVSNLVDSFKVESQFILNAPVVQTNVPTSTIILDQVGYLALVALAMIASMTWLYTKNRSESRVVLVWVAVALILLPRAFEISSIKDILPGRWEIFSYVPLSILAAQGLVGISGIIRNRVIGNSTAMFLILGMVFMMAVMNSSSNSDSPLIYNGSQRIGSTRSEIASIATLRDMKSGNPITDDLYGSVIPYIIGYHDYTDMISRGNSVLILRSYYLQNPEWNTRYIARIREMRFYTGEVSQFEAQAVEIGDYIRELDISGHPLIYSTGNIMAYGLW